MNPDFVRIAGRYAWRRLAPERERFPVSVLRRRLGGILERELLAEWLERAADEVDDVGIPVADSVLEHLPRSVRADEGIFATPEPLAAGLAAAVAPAPGERVLDLSAGTGALLEAAARREPEVRLVGVERRPSLAVVAAIRLAAADVDDARIRIFCGDGLANEGPWSSLEGEVEAVVANPPYVREKGRARRFRQLRERHDHLAEYCGPRIDLAYLFVHRSLDFAAGGARLAFLTSAYWLTATGARDLRSDLARRARPLAFARVLEQSLFESAPGHHSLISVFERSDASHSEAAPPRAVTVRGGREDWAGLLHRITEGASARIDADLTEPPREAFEDAGWSPFSNRAAHEWRDRLRREGTPLGELVDDRQGFVSGADRVTARRLGQLEDAPEHLDAGDPGFLWNAEELTANMERLQGVVLRPVLRGSRLERGTVRVVPPAEEFVLYLDGPLADGQEWVVDHLAPLRPALEDRREVRRGSMPWYRLHWPRDRTEQTGPKLVVPRRAREPRFALDLSASAVSSDCTYLVAPDEIESPVRYLLAIMVALNRPEVGRYLRHFGKRKGGMLEFYSEPLRNLPLPLSPDGEGMKWNDELLGEAEIRALTGRVSALADALESGRVDPDGCVRARTTRTDRSR